MLCEQVQITCQTVIALTPQTGQLCALREEFTRLCYNPDFSNLHEGWLEALPSKLIPFEKCANNRSGRWLAGEDISWVSREQSSSSSQSGCAGRFYRLRAIRSD